MGTFGAATLVGLVVALGLALGACENAGGGGDSDYVVSFTVDGTDYVLTEGYTADNVFDAGANGFVMDTKLQVAAVSDAVTNMITEGPYVLITFGSAAVGHYSDVQFDIFLHDGASHHANTGFSGEITSFAASVGGTIEGTFSGDITRDADPDIIIRNGLFRVERLPDDSLSGPDAFR